MNMTTRLGYACINTELRAGRIFCSRTCRNETLEDMPTDEAVAFLREMALENINDLLTILEWNEAHGIRLFRMTSNLFPHMGNHLLSARLQRTAYIRGDTAFADEALARAGEYARRYGHRLTFHMTPYIQLGSPNEDIAKRSIFDLLTYGRVFRALGGAAANDDPVIILHVGGRYEQPKEHVIARWLGRFRTLPKDVQGWIAIENDERHYGVRDVLPVCEREGIRFCFDVFHNSISEDREPVTPALLRRTVATWPGTRPKFHLSEQAPDSPFGTHADMVSAIPEYLLGHRWDIMVEAKQKELAVLKLKRKYNLH